MEIVKAEDKSIPIPINLPLGKYFFILDFSFRLIQLPIGNDSIMIDVEFFLMGRQEETCLVKTSVFSERNDDKEVRPWISISLSDIIRNPKDVRLGFSAPSKKRTQNGFLWSVGFEFSKLNVSYRSL